MKYTFKNMFVTENSLKIDFWIFGFIFEPSEEFEIITRPTCTDFEYLLNQCSPIISKKYTHWRLAISDKLRLTLRYLTTGDSLKSFYSKVTEIISKIVPEVCIALVEVLKDQI
jgi:hypothetical protein